MHQDEAGRWVSDNGRYLWSGTEWLDLEPGPSGAPDASGTPEAPAGRGGPQDRTDELTPVRDDAGSDAADGPDAPDARDDRPPAAPRARRGAAGTGSARGAPAPPRRRRGMLLLGLLVLAAIGVVAVLLVGNRSSSKPSSAAPSPVPGAASPGSLPPSPAADAVLDEQQRRDRAERALVSRTDFPSTTEQRPVNAADVFLPCRAPALTPPPGTVLVGRTVSNSDFTVYVGQTIAGYPTAREAAEALDAVRTALGRCAPYDYDYANSPRVDRITHADVGTPLDVADGGVYLAEIDTPSNYTGTTTTYSYGYVRRGQFLVRLTLTNRSQADRGGVERLMTRITGQLG